MAKKSNKQVYVVDTSVILDNWENVQTLSDNGANEIVLPEIVLDEVDHNKNGSQEKNYQAREFIRYLDKFKLIKTEAFVTHIVTTLTFDNVSIKVVINDDLVLEKFKGLASIQNDRKILQVASHFKNCTVVSNDVALRVRASSLGIKAEHLKKDRVDNIEELTFIETLSIKSMQKRDIETTLQPEDFGKKFNAYTNVEFKYEDTGHSCLAVYKQGHFHILDEKKLRKGLIKPQNKEQLFFLNMLLDKDLPIVVCAGVTGSGKNILSLAAAIAGRKHHGGSIKYCRNTITAGDAQSQLGFLKGDENAKLSVFGYPLEDSVKFYREQLDLKALENKGKSTVVTQEDFIKENEISIINVNQMRGSNLSGFIILDEWQNSSAALNKLMLTRVLDGTKIVIIGDNNQIDHPHLNKYNNALSIMLKKAESSDIIGAVRMTKVLRGVVADYADKNL